jgi:guanosine-3',5'-bis(diphosphate) 3'-pyrophosphohydrolase
MKREQHLGGATRDLLRAVGFAAEKHRDHRRKGETAAPYINHPIAVAVQLAEAGMEKETDLLMAAILHDVVEDTETTFEELKEEFGANVAGIVMEVTDDKSLQEKERKRIAVETIGKKSEAARLLKLSDLIANVYDVIHHPPHWSADRKRRYFDWSESVAGAIRGIHPGLERQLGELLVQGRRQLAPE